MLPLQTGYGNDFILAATVKTSTLKMVNNLFSNQFGIVEASRDFDYTGQAEWSHFNFCSCSFFTSQNPVYFSCFRECCNSVLLWSPRNFPSAWGWVDCDWMLCFLLNLSFNLSSLTESEKNSTEIKRNHMNLHFLQKHFSLEGRWTFAFVQEH